jgi:hypothetical protein
VGARIRGVALVVVILAVGAYLGSALYQWSAAPGPVPAVAGRFPVVGERVRVEVLNGGGVPAMARAATDELRDEGFDVVYYGNWKDCCQDSSMVVDRVGNLEWARSVADALGIREVRSEPDSNLYLDVSVVVGRTWQPGDATEAEAEGREPLPWWHPRRLFRRPGESDNPAGSRLVDPADERGDA